MNRRRFIKCIALTPLVGLLKPKQRIIPSTPETVLEWAKKHRIEFKASKAWQGRVDIERYRRAVNESATMEGWVEKYRLTSTMATPDDLWKVTRTA